MNKENISYNENIIFPASIQTNAKNDNSNIIDQKSLLKTKESINSTIQHNETSNLKYLEKYKEVYVPKIYLMDYNDTNKYESNNTSTQNFINMQNNPYFNYGYNVEQWKIYVNKRKSKFDELNELVKKGKLKLPEPNNEMEYLMALPSDFGGLGELYHEDKYENLKLYNPKEPENINISFMRQIKFDRKETWFPLKPNPESFTKKMTFYDYLNLKYNYFNINMDMFNKNNENATGNIALNEEKENEKNNCKDEENKNRNSEDDNMEEEEEEYSDYNSKTRERSRNTSRSRYYDDYDDYYDRRDREYRNRNRFRKNKYYDISSYNDRYYNRNNYKYNLNNDHKYYYDKYKNKKTYFKHSFKNYY